MYPLPFRISISALPPSEGERPLLLPCVCLSIVFLFSPGIQSLIGVLSLYDISGWRPAFQWPTRPCIFP